MTFEESLRAELITIPGLHDKVFPLNAKEGTKAPYIIYVSSEGVRDKTLEGYLNTKEVECEINIVHVGYGDMKALTKLVIDKLLSLPVQNVSYEPPVELYENEVGLYRCVIDLKVRY